MQYWPIWYFWHFFKKSVFYRKIWLTFKKKKSTLKIKFKFNCKLQQSIMQYFKVWNFPELKFRDFLANSQKLEPRNIWFGSTHESWFPWECIILRSRKFFLVRKYFFPQKLLIIIYIYNNYIYNNMYIIIAIIILSTTNATYMYLE